MNAESAIVPFPVGRFALFLLRRAFPWPILNPAWKTAPRGFAKYLALASAFALVILGAWMTILFTYLGAEAAWELWKRDLDVSDLAGTYLAFGLISFLGLLFTIVGWQFLAHPSIENARQLAGIVATVLFVGRLFDFAVTRFELLFYSLKREPPDPYGFGPLLGLVFAYLVYRLLRSCFATLAAQLAEEASASK